MGREREPADSLRKKAEVTLSEYRISIHVKSVGMLKQRSTRSSLLSCIPRHLPSSVGQFYYQTAKDSNVQTTVACTGRQIHGFGCVNSRNLFHVCLSVLESPSWGERKCVSFMRKGRGGEYRFRYSRCESCDRLQY